MYHSDVGKNIIGVIIVSVQMNQCTHTHTTIILHKVYVFNMCMTTNYIPHTNRDNPILTIHYTVLVYSNSLCKKEKAAYGSHLIINSISPYDLCQLASVFIVQSS